MNEQFQQTRARVDFANFVTRLLAFKACNGYCDSEIPPMLTVPRETIIELFIAKHPHLSRFRGDFARVYAGLSEFCVNQFAWERMIAGNVV